MAASSSSVGQPCFNIDQNSPLWKYVDMIEQVPGGGTYVWICSGCGVRYTSSYSRVKAHLCGIPGMGIKSCPGKKDALVPTSRVLEYIREQEQAEATAALRSNHLLARRGVRSRKPPSAPSLSILEVVKASHPFFGTHEEEPTTHKRMKGPLEKKFQNDSQEIADQHIARCLYANGLSLNVVRSPYWQEMVRKINEAPKGYEGPGFEKLCTTLLEKEVKHVNDSLQLIRGSWIEIGVSIVSNGWKNAKNQPLINVIAVSPRGTMFLKAVDCEGQVKDARFIADILIWAIEEVGYNNVVQVITNDTKKCRVAGLLVEAHYSHIFWTPCVNYSLNLMLQKLGKKIDWIKQVYAEAKEIQMFITNHHLSHAIFGLFSKLELLKVAETQSASNIIVLRQLVKVREALSSMVICQLWSEWSQSNTETTINVKEIILDDTWWDRVDYLLSFTEPILSMIRYTDMDRPCLGEVYDGIDSMIEKMKAIINEKERDPRETFFKQVHKIIEERWNKMTTPLHLLAFALSPKYYSAELLSLSTRIAPYRDVEVSQGYKVAFRRLFINPDIRDAVRVEFMDFVSSNEFSIDALCDRYKVDALMWWYFHGQSFIHLQRLAIKILAQVASSSISERNWSTYFFIHSVKHNRLHSKKAEDLVYVHSNLRLLSHKERAYKEGDTRKWDIELEHTDLDASISHLAAFEVDADVELGSGHESASASASARASATFCGSSNIPIPTSSNMDCDDDIFENPYDADA